MRTCGIFEIIIGGTVLLLLADTKSQIPDCKDQSQCNNIANQQYILFTINFTDTKGVFTAVPNNIKLTCGSDSDLAAVFPCEHRFGSEVQPSWVIKIA